MSGYDGWGGGDAGALKATTNGKPANDGWNSGPVDSGDGWGKGNTDNKNGANDEWNDGRSENKQDFSAGPTGVDDAQHGDRPNDGCFNCGQPGHMKAECPNPRVSSGPCRYCKKEGHMVAECPDAPKGCGRCGAEDHMARECPKPLICLNCEQEGHFAKECPNRVCKNCGQAGHSINACTAARSVDRSHLPDMAVEAAWDMISKATTAHDADDVKEAVQIYVKASPETTYAQLEEAFRKQGLGVYLIALEKPNLAAALTNMDLQGNLGKTYTVTYRFDSKPGRPREIEGWPTPEENITRLADAGEPVDRGLPKCSNCSEIGHIAKSCPQEKQESADRAVIKCYNCDQEGHRVRDCPIPRVDKFACKNCGQGGHNAKECPEPRNPATVTCRKCEEMGHFAKDCPKDMRPCHNCGETGHQSKECTAPPKCRNCDEIGHTGRDCPKPRDYSRVKCSNCGEMGHTKVRCKQPVPVEEDDNAGGFDNAGDGGFDNNGDGFGDAGGDADWKNGGAAADAGGADW